MLTKINLKKYLSRFCLSIGTLIFVLLSANFFLFYLYNNYFTLLFKSRINSSKTSSKKIKIAIIGESAARGIPYERTMTLLEILKYYLIKNHDTEVDIFDCTTPGEAIYESIDLLLTKNIYPDLLIIYGGNNQIINKFIYGIRAPYNHKAETIILRNFYIYHWFKKRILKQNIEKIFKEVKPNLLDGFICSNLEYNQELYSFEKSISNIIKYYNKSKIILIIPGSNLSDCPPIRSLYDHNDVISKNELENLFFSANLLEKTEISNSLKLYKDIILKKQNFAAVHYKIGQLCDSLNMQNESLNAFIKAKDFDAAPIRLNEDYRKIFFRISEKFKLPVIDVEKVLLKETNKINKKYYVDAVHPHSRTNEKIIFEILHIISHNKILPIKPKNSDYEKLENILKMKNSNYKEYAKKDSELYIKNIANFSFFKNEILNFLDIPAEDY